MTTHRLAFLDALRGFAILGVILAHAASISGVDDVVRDFTNLGGYGVQLFFVISAFTIFLTFEKAVAREAAPVRNFFIRRLMRIVPVYWLGIVLYTAVYGLGSRGWRDGPELWHYPLHLTLTNLLAPSAMSSVVPGGWSISCEVLFYMTVPLWFLLIRNLRAALAFTAICVAATPVVLKILAQFMAPAFDDLDPRLVDQYWYRSFVSQLACFGFGITLFYLVKEPKAQAVLARKGAPLALMVVAAVVFVIGFRHPPFISFHHLYAAAFMLAGLVLSASPWPLLVNQITTFIGRISYSAYLVHFLVLELLHRFFTARLPTTGARFIVEIALGLAITLPLAYVSFRLIETPTANLARRWIGTLESRKPAVAANVA